MTHATAIELLEDGFRDYSEARLSWVRETNECLGVIDPEAVFMEEPSDVVTPHSKVVKVWCWQDEAMQIRRPCDVPKEGSSIIVDCPNGRIGGRVVQVRHDDENIWATIRVAL